MFLKSREFKVVYEFLGGLTLNEKNFSEGN